MRKVGSGAFHMGTLKEAVAVGTKIGVALDGALAKKLEQEEKLGIDREKIGFLRLQ